MAKTLIEQTHGSVGPTTYQGSRYGTIRRARVRPINPQSTNQQNQRAILAAVAGEWRGLTQDVRNAWEATAAKLPGNPTGFQAYVQVNATLVTCGMPKLESPPLAPSFGILGATALVVDDTPTIKLTQVVDTVAPDRFIIQAAPPVSQGVKNVKTDFRLLTVLPGHAGPAADLDLTAAYVARFGAPKATQRVTVRICAMKDGFKGVPEQFTAIVAAHNAPQMAAPAGNAWNLARNGTDAVATYVGPPPAGANWEAQFRPLGEPAWQPGGGDTLEAALTATFNPWPQGGVEARVRYTDDQGQALSDWSLSKQLA